MRPTTVSDVRELPRKLVTQRGSASNFLPAVPERFTAAVLGAAGVAMIFVAVSAAFVVNTLMESARSSLMGLGLLALGVPVYLWSRRVAR